LPTPPLASGIFLSLLGVLYYSIGNTYLFTCGCVFTDDGWRGCGHPREDLHGNRPGGHDPRARQLPAGPTGLLLSESQG